MEYSTLKFIYMEAISTPFWLIGELESQGARVNRMPTVHKEAMAVTGFSFHCVPYL